MAQHTGQSGGCISYQDKAYDCHKEEAKPPIVQLSLGGPGKTGLRSQN